MLRRTATVEAAIGDIVPTATTVDLHPRRGFHNAETERAMTEMPAGPPSVPPAAEGRGPATGKQLLGACWRMLREDREMLWLPFIGAIFALIAWLALFVPGALVGWAVSGQ